MNFTNKSAIVTGAGRGIGWGIASELANRGARVLLNDIDPEAAQAAVSKLEKVTGEVIACPGDVGDPAFVRSMVAMAKKSFGKIDLIVANAGLTLFGDFFTYTPEDFYEVMRVNLGGSFFLAQAAAYEMREQKNGGKILFLSSVTGHQAHKDLAAYSMSKAALEMLARNLVIELSPYQINVNAIAPGATLTERTMQDEDYETNWKNYIPIGRPATVPDITNAALFLLSEMADHITGQTIIVDGGWTSTSPQPPNTR